MAEEIREQTGGCPAADTMPESGKTETDSYGKFKNKEGLWEAYRSLEAEFTRRSQRLKELEHAAEEKKTVDKWAQKVEALTKNFPAAKELGGEIGEYLEQRQELLTDENCLEKALLHVLARGYMPKAAEGTAAAGKTGKAPESEKIQNALQEILAPPVPEVTYLSGEIPVVLPYRPKTIGEAGELAKKMIRNLKQ